MGAKKKKTHPEHEDAVFENYICCWTRGRTDRRRKVSWKILFPLKVSQGNELTGQPTPIHYYIIPARVMEIMTIMFAIVIQKEKLKAAKCKKKGNKSINTYLS